MTPEQYYFPYIFNQKKFNDELKAFDLSSMIIYDADTGLPDKLLVTRPAEVFPLITIPFGATFMLDAAHLFYWETDTNLLDIYQADLKSLTPDPWILNTKLGLDNFHIGKNSFQSFLETDCLVSYAKKDSINYDPQPHEKYAVIILEKKQVNIIPFDWFNKQAAEEEYMWPATARFDFNKATLYGRGIRMQDFCVSFDKTKL